MKYVPHNLPSWQHFTNSLFVEREASCWQDRSFSFLFVSFVELLQRSLLCFNYLSATFDGGIFRLYPRCLKYLQKASGYMCLFNLSAQIKLLLHLHVKAFSHPSQGKSLCKASVLPPSKHNCSPAGKMSPPGHAVPPECAAWAIYCIPVACQASLGKSQGMYKAEEQAAIPRLTPKISLSFLSYNTDIADLIIETAPL